MDGEAAPRSMIGHRGEQLLKHLFRRAERVEPAPPGSAPRTGREPRPDIDPGPDFLDAEMLEAFDSGRPIRFEFPPLRIRYCDASGITSERTIEALAALRPPSGDDVYLRAHCQLSGGTRFFRASRIERLIDLATGHYVARHAVAPYITEMLEGTYAYRIYRAAMSPLGADRLRCLLWVARADGHMSRSRRHALQEVLLADAGIRHPSAADRACCDIELDAVAIDRPGMRAARDRLAARGRLLDAVRIARLVADLGGVRSERLERAVDDLMD